MARSTQVYVVTDGATPVAGFTVKYELQNFLGTLDWFANPGPFEVWRIRDGRYLTINERKPTQMFRQDFAE